MADMIRVNMDLSEENNDFLTELKEHMNENPGIGHYGRYSKMGVLNKIVSEARIKFEKQKAKGAAE